MRSTAVVLVWLFPTLVVADPVEVSPCVDALEQLMALQAESPVYKLAGDKPQFIEDADRPAEIARVQKSVSTLCSTDAAQRKKQEAEAYRVHVARSPECNIAKDNLDLMLMPESRDPKDRIRQQLQVVARYCPPVPISGRWLVLTAGGADEPGLAR